jgi:DNA-binding MarR family transcriptional regulator
MVQGLFTGSMKTINEVLVALRRIIRAADLHSRHLVKTTGLTSAQLLLMRTLRESGPMTINKLSNSIQLSQATVTTILDRLEGRELVSRERSSEDKRKVFVDLTAVGKSEIAETPLPLQERFVREFSQLAGWEQSLILSSLQRVGEMMDAGEIDASPFLDVGDLDREDE